MTDNDGFEIIVIGAGLSGLTAAQYFSQKGRRVQVVDKGRSVGGRLATRRMAGGLADHGAQFFTVRSAHFEEAVQQWSADGLVYEWSRGFSDGTRHVEQFDGHPRYAVRGGMNALAKSISAAIKDTVNIQTNVKIVTVERGATTWRLIDEQGAEYKAGALLMTPPVPQSLALVGEYLTTDERRALEQIAYAPCVAGLFDVVGGVRLPEPGALQRPEAAISWISDNQQKGISPDARIITVHANGTTSQQLWEQPEVETLAFLRQELEMWLDDGAEIREAELKRWRYAQPTALHGERYLISAGTLPVGFAGDGFGEARVEGAYLSGLAAAEALHIRL